MFMLKKVFIKSLFLILIVFNERISKADWKNKFIIMDKFKDERLKYFAEILILKSNQIYLKEKVSKIKNI